jgi:hypothetical protein
MKKVIALVVVFVVFVVLVYMYRTRETYILPNFSGTGSPSDICPDGYVLTCVSQALEGIEETIPFPPSLPNPCPDPDFPAFPLCLPDPKHIRPPVQQYNKKVEV